MMRYLGHIQGTNCAEWVCEFCGQNWIGGPARVPVCDCLLASEEWND
jgi:rubrerythrin